MILEPIPSCGSCHNMHWGRLEKEGALRTGVVGSNIGVYESFRYPSSTGLAWLSRFSSRMCCSRGSMVSFKWTYPNSPLNV